MKKILFIAAIMLASAFVSCSKDDTKNSQRDKDVKLVSMIKGTYDFDYYPNDLFIYELEYDAENRITRYGRYTFSYNGNSMIVDGYGTDDYRDAWEIYGCKEQYICELNSDGYITDVEYVISYGFDAEYRGREKYTYKEGYLMSIEEQQYYDDELYNYTYNWQNGNIVSIDGRYFDSDHFTYSQYKNIPINLDLFYLPGPDGATSTSLFGLLGFLGRQNEYLRSRFIYDVDDSDRFEYIFNDDGTVSKIKFGDYLYMELYY